MDNDRKSQIFFSLNSKQSRTDSQMSATADRQIFRKSLNNSQH